MSSSRSAFTMTLYKSAFKFIGNIGQLLPEWKALFSTKDLKQDVFAGFTVACVAVPLSLAIALASGVSPATGLITAIVGGIVCALFGGTTLAVSGPAAAMAVLVASTVQQFGVGGLLVVILGSGVLQFLSGAFGLGRFAKLVPTPVIMGFTAGIGAIILIGQLPRALGLPPPHQAQVIHALTDLSAELANAHLIDLSLVILTLVIIFGLPKLTKRIPSTLVAVILPSILVFLLSLDEAKIGEIPRSLPLPKMPTLPETGYLELVTATFMVFALASLETLLSSSAVDKIAKGVKKHDPNQELVGQGLGNIASALFGGIAVTGVIARSALNVQAGARTRRSAIIHSLVLIAIIFLFAPFISQIPIAVLAGVLLSVSLKMLNPKEIIGLWKSSRSAAGVYALTFFVIVFVDLMVGVQAGIAAALLVSAVQLGRVRLHFHSIDSDGPYRFAIDGPLTFVSASKLSELDHKLKNLDPNRGIVLDFSKVTSIDTSGGEQVSELVSTLKDHGLKVALQGVSLNCQRMLIASDSNKTIQDHFAVTEAEVNRILAITPSSLNRLAYGVEGFRKVRNQQYRQLFDQLAQSQNPHTLFITCCDSRIDPNLITSTSPGELFVVRNVGNIIPPYSASSTHSEAAAIEFAINVLRVKDIVICGHSGCGAVKAVLSPETFNEETSLTKWLSYAEEIIFDRVGDLDVDKAARLNARKQIKNIATYHYISQKIENHEIRLHAWFYDIGRGELEQWNSHIKSFVPVTGSTMPEKVGENYLHQ